MDGEELEILKAWLCDQDLLVGVNSKELPPEYAACRFLTPSKYQFGETLGETEQQSFLCHLVPFRDKLVVV